MGLLRALRGSIRDVLHEQWKERFSCDTLPADTLLLRAKKQVSARSANADTEDGIVTNGSVLAVADGQCAIVAKQGRVIGLFDAPGEHRFCDPDHPGGIFGFFRDVKARVAFGGDVQPVRYRVYYVNTKECHGNRFNTPAPVAVRVADAHTGADLDLSVSAGGVFSYRVEDPAALYRCVGNVEDRCDRSYLNAQLLAELLSALSPAIAEIVRDGVRPYQLPAETRTLGEAVIAAIKESFLQRFGVALLSVSFDMLRVEEAWMLVNGQRAAMLKDPSMAAATLVDAAAQALRDVTE